MHIYKKNVFFFLEFMLVNLQGKWLSTAP